jgi:hypothetical protein
MNKQKHYDLIVAWAEGHQMEVFDNQFSKWTASIYPSFLSGFDYRIKPEPVRDVLRDALIINSLSAGPLLYAASPSEANVEMVFDGTTGKLKAVSFKQL